MDGKGMEGFIHATLQCVVNFLVLLDAGQPAKAFRRDMGGVMVAVARQVVDAHRRVRNAGNDQGFYVLRAHRHGAILFRRQLFFRVVQTVRQFGIDRMFGKAQTLGRDVLHHEPFDVVKARFVQIGAHDRLGIGVGVGAA